MLPPIPQGLHPVTSQQDVVKPKPVIAPVVPAQESAKGDALGFEKDDVFAAQERAREEQRRRQRQHSAEQSQDSVQADDADTEHGETSQLSRQGVWIDVKV